MRLKDITLFEVFSYCCIIFFFAFMLYFAWIAYNINYQETMNNSKEATDLTGALDRIETLESQVVSLNESVSDSANVIRSNMLEIDELKKKSA